METGTIAEMKSLPSVRIMLVVAAAAVVLGAAFGQTPHGSTATPQAPKSHPDAEPDEAERGNRVWSAKFDNRG